MTKKTSSSSESVENEENWKEILDRFSHIKIRTEDIFFVLLLKKEKQQQQQWKTLRIQ